MGKVDRAIQFGGGHFSSISRGGDSVPSGIEGAGQVPSHPCIGGNIDASEESGPDQLVAIGRGGNSRPILIGGPGGLPSQARVSREIKWAWVLSVGSEIRRGDKFGPVG